MGTRVSQASKDKDNSQQKSRYRTDPEFRARELQRRQDYHQKNKQSQNYLDCIAQRKAIYTTQEAIEYHRNRIHTLQKRLTRQIYRKEELEIAWGKERAERKAALRLANSGTSPDCSGTADPCSREQAEDINI